MSIETNIAELIDKYQHELNRAQSEADVRVDYIDWLFFYLGWNVRKSYEL